MSFEGNFCFQYRSTERFTIHTFFGDILFQKLSSSAGVEWEIVNGEQICKFFGWTTLYLHRISLRNFLAWEEKSIKILSNGTMSFSLSLYVCQADEQFAGVLCIVLCCANFKNAPLGGNGFIKLKMLVSLQSGENIDAFGKIESISGSVATIES